ncbi:hypothetical protein [Humidesulfovibrio idahonensis]
MIKKNKSLWTIVIGVLFAVFGAFIVIINDRYTVVELVSAFAGFITSITFSISLYDTIKKKKNFGDIDEQSSKNKTNMMDVSGIKTIVGSEISKISMKADVDYDKISDAIAKSIEKSNVLAQHANFIGQCQQISSSLMEKANVSDKKASELLDRGTGYVWLGILFYISSIIVWQIFISYSQGILVQHYYGIAACSFLFLFIEFLSAWFLRQYRHFVDTSTYLLKVKSIFDRYVLLYCALEGKEKDVADDQDKVKIIAKVLSEKFPWPSDTHLTKEDVAFTREAVDSFAKLFNISKQSKKSDESN